MARYIESVGGRVAVAVMDRRSGVKMIVGDMRFHTASIVKVNILAALLLRSQASGEPLTDAQHRLATAMIRWSDNGAADQAWSLIGGASGLRASNKTLGLIETTPGTAGHWGLTTTTVTDQLRLLQAITNPRGPLTHASRGYVLGQMARVVKWQQWGITAGRRTGSEESRVYLKTGRVTISADNGRWVIDSIGRIIEPGHDWLVAVLSDHHRTDSDGKKIVEHAVRLAVDGLRR